MHRKIVAAISHGLDRIEERKPKTYKAIEKSLKRIEKRVRKASS